MYAKIHFNRKKNEMLPQMTSFKPILSVFVLFKIRVNVVKFITNV